jgi:hypothetical protein
MNYLYTKQELDTVLDYLATGQWVLSKEITYKCAINARKLRQMSEMSGEFLGGQDGYKRVDKATTEEIKHAYNALMSRASKITSRAEILQSYL